jgi:hypothetical protein
VVCAALVLAACWGDDESGSTFDDAQNCVLPADGARVAIGPVDVTVYEGQPAEFRVVALGRDPLVYDWARADVASRDFHYLRDENASTLVLPSVSLNDNGSRFIVKVDNDCVEFSDISEEATLTVRPALEITQHPQSITVASGQPANFTVKAGGIPPLSYKWQRRDAAGNILGLPSANAPSLTLPATVLAESGDRFWVEVTNSASPPATESSEEAVLTVQEPLSVLSASVSPELPAGVPAYPTGLTSFILAELGRPDARLRVSCLRPGPLLCEPSVFDTSPPFGEPLLAEVTLPRTMLADTFHFGLRATLGDDVSEERVLSLELKPGTGVLRCEQTSNGAPGDLELRTIGLQLQTAGGDPIANADYQVHNRATTGRGWADFRTVMGKGSAILTGSPAVIAVNVSFQAIAVERGGNTPPRWAGREWVLNEPPIGSTRGCQPCSNARGGTCRIIPLEQ